MPGWLTGRGGPARMWFSVAQRRQEGQEGQEGRADAVSGATSLRASCKQARAGVLVCAPVFFRGTGGENMTRWESDACHPGDFTVL